MNEKLFSSREAAAYLGITLRTLKYHLYTAKTLTPSQMIGKTLVFTQSDLDAFNARRRKVGRPSKSASDED